MADDDTEAGNQSADSDAGSAESADQTTAEQTDDVDAMRRALERANAQAKQLRSELKDLRPLAERAKALDDEQKSEAERLAEQLTDYRTRVEQTTGSLDRLRVALQKAPAGLDLQRIESLAARLQGSTVEELEADAVELFAQLAPAQTQSAGPARTPVEQLRPGSMVQQADVPLLDQIRAAELAGDWKKSAELKAQQFVELQNKQQT